ncbi:MAG TPA: SRPBCC family protein [Candidatus Marinimicrobia bacterium]|nr:SRPBCC family protein [Candidatus Neomarinimicrobiota bacterium]
MEKYSISKKQVISRTLKEVFSFFEKPENLSVITPKNLEFDILTPKPIKMDRGTVIDYTINLFCIPVHWRTLITEYCPPYKFVDVQIKGPFILWHHTHIFREIDDGVEIIDQVQYALPFGILGRIFHSLCIKKKLNHIFNFREEVIEKLFNSMHNDEKSVPGIQKISL